MQARRSVPLVVKLVYTAFLAVMIPVYWANYGPTNFLYFCDVALLITLVGVWLESPLLVSMPAVGILLPQSLWVIDFLATALGHPITGMTAYMFAADHSLLLRSLSLFHGWLPFFLVYLVARLGYDRRALPGWTVLAWTLLLFCYFLTPPPNPNAGLTPVNINYVWGLNDSSAQTWMPGPAWFVLLLVGMPTLLFVPTHFLLKKFMPIPVANPPAASGGKA